MHGETVVWTVNSSASDVRLGELETDVLFLTRTLRALMRAQTNHVRSKLGVEPGEIGVLKLLSENPGISQNALAETVVIKKSAVTQIVRTLVDRGLIVRRQQVADKRYKSLELTEEGRRRLDDVNREITALQDHWFDGFAPGERDQLCRLLLKLIDNIGRQGQPDLDWRD